MSAEAMELEPLTMQESTRLMALEKIVTTGLQSWIEVGEALIEIRDSRLYKIEAKTFEEYCQTRFKMDRTYAHRLMNGAPIAKDLLPKGNISERAVREIAKVAPERRQEIFDKATESASGHVPTAREIKHVVSLDEEEGGEEPPATKPSIQLKIINKGMTHWKEAKAALEKIFQHDLSREDALREALSYVTMRLEANK